MSFLEVLPLVFVMIAGPQILSPIFLATTENWRRNSAAYVAGAALSITFVVTVAYVFGVGAVGQGASNTTLSAVVLVTLMLAMVDVPNQRRVRATAKGGNSEPQRLGSRSDSAFSF